MIVETVKYTSFSTYASILGIHFTSYNLFDLNMARGSMAQWTAVADINSWQGIEILRATSNANNKVED